ncbi:MAG TPA: S41 family peptidase [Candidatus Sulfotelmatobacter sp.]|nr:S41 family peptidase [Candidatus Sulfotelmatobacter sp.]
MLRLLYQGLLCLHPPAFRKRFAEEMQSIFDQITEKSARFRLLADGFVSLVRQWSLRPEFWHEFASGEPAVASDGVPSFYTLDPFRPRTAAVVHGLILTATVFCITCFAIRYSWIHVLHVRIPQVQFESPSPVVPGAAARADEREAAFDLRGRRQDDFSRSSRSPRGLQTQASGPTPVTAAEQNARSISQSEPAGQAGNPARGASAFHATQNSSSQAGGTPQSSFQQTVPTGSGQSGTPVQPGVSTPPLVPNAKIEAAERRRVIEAAVANLKQYYFDHSVAEKTAEALLAHEKDGDDDAATQGAALAALLTTQMRLASSDMHLVMEYSQHPLPSGPPVQTPEAAARFRNAMLQQHCMIRKAEILPHDIGYLKLDFFPDDSVCGAEVREAMASLNHAKAVIFDLRDNSGGFPATVSLVASYLFDHPVYMYGPRGAPTVDSWTRSPVDGNNLADKPVYVLTSGTTWSGAEQFSYDLKMLKRATLVGETTRGGAHAGVFHRIDDHFGMGIPEERSINPYGKTDWEGVGVSPDVKVSAADALDTAIKLAIARLQSKER